jgi:CBS-domain-containing membrane protein
MKGRLVMIPFLKRMTGGGQRPPKVNLSEVFWSWLGTFLGLSLVCSSLFSCNGQMHLTQTLHAPGRATALIAVIGSEKVHELGFWYMVVPVGLGVAIMLIVVLVINNMASKRKYLELWF